MAGKGALRNNRFNIILLVIAVVAVLVYRIGLPLFMNHHVEVYEVEIIKESRVTYGALWNRHKYLYFTERLDDGSTIVFENTDFFPQGKFNSSDFYTKIKVGERYRLTVVGMRWHYGSMYQNIIEFEKIE